MADRIKNYQQEADQITTLKEIRTDLGVTPSSYTPDATVVTKDRVVTFAQAEEELVVLSDIEKGVKQQVTEVDIAQKDIANIKALLQGHLYDYQTDSSSAYAKSVPSGAMPYAGLESLGGKTVVWNQLMQDGYNTANGGTVTVDDDGVMTYEFTSVGTNRINLKTPTVTRYEDNHKYLVLLDYYTPHNMPSLFYRINVGSGLNKSTSLENTSTINQWTTAYALYTGGDNGATLNYPQISLWQPENQGFEVGDEIKLKNIMWFDLTLMFGSGNEPSTVAEFESMFPADYYEYNAGTLLSAGVTSIFSEGQNLINPANFTTSGVSFADGVITVDVGTKNYRDIYAGTLYTGTAVPIADIPKLPFLMPGTYTVANDGLVGAGQRISAFTVSDDGTVTQLSGSTVSSFVITITQPTRVTLRVRFTGTVTNLRLTKTESAVPYKPYFSVAYPIPAEIQALEGYGWSCPDHYNYIDYEAKKYVQEVGSRAYASGDESDSTVITDGTNTYYPLTTAVETDISAYITDDNLINVEANGTLTFPNSNGTDYLLPVPSSETYMIDLQEAIQ